MNEIEQLAQEVLKKLNPRQREVAITASNHTYRCTCEHCLEWWAAAGPDGEQAGNYGPFTKEQVNAKQAQLGYQITP